MISKRKYVNMKLYNFQLLFMKLFNFKYLIQKFFFE